MKNRLIIIGKNLYLNAPFMNYIERELNHLGFLDQIIKLPETSSKTVTILQEQMTQEGNIVIITNKNAFTPVSKLISTMVGDSLILKENLLIPSKSEIYDDNSFLIKFNESTINVAMAEPGQTLPIFLIEHSEDRGYLHIFQMDEESAKILLDPLSKTYEVNINITTLTPGWLQIEALSKKYGQLEHFLKGAKQLLPEKAIVTENIFAHIVKKLSIAKKSITFAESCTGGLVATQLTKESGASNIFKGSLVTYSNSLKAGWLGVEKEILKDYGAVSKECVEQMLIGAKEITKADYALAVSGIAGPKGGTLQKPVGTVYIGALGEKEPFIEELHFEGDRQYIQEQSMYYAYKLLLQIGLNDFF
jgi:nicotinamide-nucleotide amidase